MGQIKDENKKELLDKLLAIIALLISIASFVFFFN